MKKFISRLFNSAVCVAIILGLLALNHTAYTDYSSSCSSLDFHRIHFDGIAHVGCSQETPVGTAVESIFWGLAELHEWLGLNHKEGMVAAAAVFGIVFGIVMSSFVLPMLDARKKRRLALLSNMPDCDCHICTM